MQPHYLAISIGTLANLQLLQAHRGALLKTVVFKPVFLLLECF